MFRGVRTMKNQVVKHYLIQWYYFDKNVNTLDPVDEMKMKILYSALKELGPEERGLLAAKYRVAERPYKKDSLVAISLGMTEKEYSKRRIQIEDKLRPIFRKYIEKIENNAESTVEQVEEVARLKGVSYEAAINEIVYLYAPVYVEKLKKRRMTSEFRRKD